MSLDIQKDAELVSDIAVEELVEDAVNLSDCASTASSIGTAGSCAATIACAGSIISCGENQLR